jgi:excisionase family DNA binding protein
MCHVASLTINLVLRVPELAEVLKINRGMAYELVNSGQIPSIRIGRSIRVPVDALRKWIELQ